MIRSFAECWRTLVAAIFTTAVLAGSAARAGCSLEDVANAFYGTLKATSDCKSVCESEESCDAAIALELALAGVAIQSSDTGKGQDLVNQFCAQAQGTADQVVSTLNTIFGNAIAQEVLGDLSAQLSSIGSAAKVVRCACETEQSTNSLGADLGQCAQEALCSIGIDFGCACQRPAPRTAQCPSIDPAKCQSKDYIQQLRDPTCIPAGSIANCNPNYQQCGYAGYAPSVVKTETPEGTLVMQVPPSAEGTGCNDAVQSCFCPKPMKPQWHEVANPGSGDHRYIFSCDCPEGTHAGATMPTGISSCLCDQTNQPANLGFAPFGMCPPPACPAGQSRLSPDGECVTPCADPSQGMAFDGSCCNPAQMTSCGQCCPPGTLPDPKSGSCVPRPKPPK
jgi:hypothetical protein